MNQKGFTLIELLMASALFAFVLVFAVFGFVQINSAFNKGLTVKRVQETARIVIQDISSSIQTTIGGNSGNTLRKASVGGYNLVCIGNDRYIWYPGLYNPNTIDFGLARDTEFGNCDNNNFIGGNDNLVQLAESRIAVEELLVEPLDASNNYAYRVRVSLIINDASLLNAAQDDCNIANGDEFCDKATFETVVTQRY